MPGFERLSRRWRDKGVAFVGVSNETPEIVGRFAREIGITYPLWTGGDEAMELSRRLGNRLSVLPFTAVVGPSGNVVAAKVGAYREQELQQVLEASSAKTR
jgi:peroxiredoxin